MVKGKGGSPGTPTPDWDKDWPPKPKPVKKQKLAKAKSLFSTPYHDDLRNINKFRENADKVFKRKKPTNNNVNET